MSFRQGDKMNYLKLLRENNQLSKDDVAEEIGSSVKLVTNIESGKSELTYNQAKEIAAKTDKHPLYLQYRVNGSVNPVDVARAYYGKEYSNLAFTKYLTMVINGALENHVEDTNEIAKDWPNDYYSSFEESEEYKSVKDLAERGYERAKELIENVDGKVDRENKHNNRLNEIRLGWSKDGMSEYLKNEAIESLRAFLASLSAFSDNPKETYNRVWNRVWDTENYDSLLESVADLESKPLTANVEPPAIVLNDANKRELVTNLKENERCPYEEKTLDKLNCDELQELAKLCKPIADYSGRGLPGKEETKPRSIVLNDSQND